MGDNQAIEKNRATAGFTGRTVLSFESRRSEEIATLIENCGSCRSPRSWARRVHWSTR
jgi:hypothetical protein